MPFSPIDWVHLVQRSAALLAVYLQRTHCFQQNSTSWQCPRKRRIISWNEITISTMIYKGSYTSVTRKLVFWLYGHQTVTMCSSKQSRKMIIFSTKKWKIDWFPFITIGCYPSWLIQDSKEVWQLESQINKKKKIVNILVLQHDSCKRISFELYFF